MIRRRATGFFLGVTENGDDEATNQDHQDELEYSPQEALVSEDQLGHGRFEKTLLFQTILEELAMKTRGESGPLSTHQRRALEPIFNSVPRHGPQRNYERSFTSVQEVNELLETSLEAHKNGQTPQQGILQLAHAGMESEESGYSFCPPRCNRTAELRRARY